MDRVRVSSEREGRGGGRECIIALTTRTSALLDGVRGKPPVDRKAVAALIAGVSRFGAANGARLRELDLNPVMATPCGVVAVDWLMVLD